MNLELSEDQQMLVDTLDRLFGETCSPARLRQVEPSGIDDDLWRTLVEMGVPLLRATEVRGGGGGSLLHSVLAAEAAGRSLAPVPLCETLAAVSILSALGESAHKELDSVSNGQALTLALFDVARQPVQLVPAGALEAGILYLEGDGVGIFWPQERTGFPNLGGLPATQLDLRGAGRRVLFTVPGARDRFLAGIEEYKLLTTALIAAAARKALDLAAGYARERIAFGKPIGSYQGIAHPLADALCEIEGVQLLARRAAERIALSHPSAAATLSLASWFVRTKAPAAVITAMRVFGGYGMTMDYDAQLYYRRVTAWSLLAGDPESELDTAAARLFDQSASPLPAAGDVGISFELSAEAETVAARARTFASAHVDDECRRSIYLSLDTHQPDFNRKAAAEGLLYVDWDAGVGGPGLGSEAAFGVREVLSDAGWIDISVGTTDIVGKIIAHFGSDKAKREILPRLLSGGSYCALGYTEPTGGSDIFGARTVAFRDGDGWRIKGQKIFTSQGHLAEYCLLLARTAKDRPKHESLTLFVVPLRQPGYEVSEIRTVSDERTNITFYDNVFVPDEYRIGEENGALRAMALALTIEQSGGDFYTHELKVMYRSALEWATTVGAAARPIDRRPVRHTLAELAAAIEIQDVLVRRCVWELVAGKLHKAHGPMSKLYGSEAGLALGHKLLAVAAPNSLGRGFSPLGLVEKQARRAIPGTIYGGTSEVQRSIIAESGLGLPRSR